MCVLHFYQDNALVYNSILVTGYLSKMGINTVPHRPYSPELAPCDFCLFPKLSGCRYETVEMKEAVTKIIDTLLQEGLPWGLPEVVGTIQQVHYSRGRLLQRGLEFHVCTINKSALTKKSGNLFNDPRICIFIFVHVCLYIFLDIYVVVYTCVYIYVCIFVISYIYIYTFSTVYSYAHIYLHLLLYVQMYP